ncbi:hypothetical protein SAMN02745227_02067 [Anaerobranca californiensis DSM 14826]|jgi:membrane protease YdiL (CAAX protease family)|uniref:CAAX prenyl protease 2/Lysostaphin resistance protein A-like domain-containing protein n=1 Tax=Anaerobranca californiensis DSM 14826 TaxID=1120989 RepID=A0A1M6RLJ8_9FIRM|nr:CPBP family intramembrane glutamic endopeptidase [Anaerobranca californiensis]SHK33371.1 hypothetical protein SAMN02745227_02067 [Anaerobranca californiensis DSM 14826]
MLNVIKVIYKNPIGKTFLGLIFAFLFGISALSLSIAFNEQLGIIDTPYNIKETYKFHNWTINFDYLTIEFPKGGYVIPGYHNDRIASLLIIAEGTATFKATDTFKKVSSYQFPIVLEISEMVLPIHHEDFERLKGDTIFIQEEITYPLNYLEEKIESVKSLLYKGNILGLNRIIPPSPRSVMIKFNSPLEGEINYWEDEKIVFNSKEINYSFNHAIGEKLYPLPYTLQINLLYNFLLLLAFLGLIAFLTTDFDYDKKQINYLDKNSSLIHLLVFTVYSLGVKWLSFYYHLEIAIQGILYLIPVLYLSYWVIIAKVPLTDFGITSKKIIKSIFVPIVIFYLLFISTTFQLIPENSYTTTSLFSILLVILLQQIIFRGFIQFTLETFLGKWPGIIITSSILAAFYLITPLQNNHNTVLTFFSYWSISLIITYSYHRTRNIITPLTLILLLNLFVSHLY